MKRSSAVSDRARALFKRTQPACHICGRAIDFTLPHLDPGSFVVDHVIPLHRGGADALTNLKAAHRHPSVQLHEASTHPRTHRAQVRVARVAHPFEVASNTRSTPTGKPPPTYVLRPSGASGNMFVTFFPLRFERLFEYRMFLRGGRDG